MVHNKQRLVCNYQGCNKSFSRIDHLNRHKLNHDVGSHHKCGWPGCGKTFVRKDVYKRHYEKQHQGIGRRNHDDKPLKFIYMNNINFEEDEGASPSIDKSASSDEHMEDVPELHDNVKYSTDHIQTRSTPIVTPMESTNQPGFSIDDLVTSNEMIKWLFGGIENQSDSNSQISVSPDLHDIHHSVPRDQQDSFHSSIGDQLIGFPFSNQQTFIDQEVIESLLTIVPSLTSFSQFTPISLTKYLEYYWDYYHQQFPILNSPSFSTKEHHPILILAMLTIGIFISTTLSQDIGSTQREFADSIANPLRIAIYESKDFKPPPKPWVIQSLIILETYEICCTSRDMHVRANLHRGLSIQMLKRSPFLGGNPWIKYTNSYSETTTSLNVSPYSSQTSWKRWIEEESMRRCALTVFYLETLHAVVFGHDTIIGLHEVKPTLPCNEEFWKTGKYCNDLTTSMTLLGAIRNILRKKSVKIQGFGEKIILAGLIALSLEIKDREFEFSLPELESIKQLWQTKINEAFSFWDLRCITSNNTNNSTNVSWLNSCYLPLRELYESYTQIKHYDFMVYAGATGRMNVEIGSKELDVVVSRVVDWANGIYGKRAIVLIYSYFCNTLFTGGEIRSFNYKPREDFCLYRKQMISHMLVILWCWCFFNCGPESHALKWDTEDSDKIPSKEEGHAYLNRIKYELTMLTGQSFTRENVYKDIDLFAGVLHSIPARENIVGLIRLFEGKYSNDLSEIAREHSRLLKNCINRSLGSGNIFCKNMFE